MKVPGKALKTTLQLVFFVLLAPSIYTVSCTNKKDGFSFIQVCDPQLGMGGYNHDTTTLRQAVNKINEMDCDFVVICGDLVNHASDSSYHDFMNIVKALKVSCYMVPGNHDVGNLPDDTSLEYYRKTVGKDYFALEHKGYAFVFTNSQLWKNDSGPESARQDQWLKNTLKKMREMHFPVIVIGHYPLFVVELDEQEEYFNLPSDKRQELLELFLGNHVIAYLSGHRHETLINAYCGIRLVSGETTSKNFDARPLGFRYWRVRADSLSNHFIPITISTDPDSAGEGESVALKQILPEATK